MKTHHILPLAALAAAFVLVGASCSSSTTTNTAGLEVNVAENANTTLGVPATNGVKETEVLNVSGNENENVNAMEKEETNANSATNTSASTNISSSTKASVSIDNSAFGTKTLTVKKGATVTWTNDDSVAHTVTSATGAELSSGTLAVGKTYSHTFDTVGTFAYKCTLHPTMTATVVVTE